MPDTGLKSTPDHETDEEREARLDAEAWADVAAGRVVPHERVREWLLKLEKGIREPPPRA
jgi:predicted transcriptional regulator